jgi:hypothetical protein
MVWIFFDFLHGYVLGSLLPLLPPTSLDPSPMAPTHVLLDLLDLVPLHRHREEVGAGDEFIRNITEATKTMFVTYLQPDYNDAQALYCLRITTTEN